MEALILEIALNGLYLHKSRINVHPVLEAYPPHKIWWNFVSYILDYGDFYFKLECVSEVADSQFK